MVLADTDVMIDVLRRHSPAVKWMSAHERESLAIPGFVLLELIQGCLDKRSQARVLEFAERCRVVWLSQAGFEKAVKLFAEHRLSSGLDMIDVLVGQTALDLGVPLATFNKKHYACIPGVEVHAPYER